MNTRVHGGRGKRFQSTKQKHRGKGRPTLADSSDRSGAVETVPVRIWGLH
ncbi:MAG: hypothetical protein R3C05_25940 [Pirellulaceae bacterium]